MAEIDRIDRRILNRLQQNNRISNQALAEAVGLSPPACLRRVRRLREAGYIVSDVALVDPLKVGQRLNIIVEVEMTRDQLDIYDSFVRKMQAAPEVSQCYQVTGEVDFVLVVQVPDMQAYEAFARRDLASDPQLNKFRSLISLRREKFDTAIEL
ncbi:Lrp/AsnC family transcriptional regulator [Motiliproteus sediminis]|uniref:Lrp/AsnC family transcriptional regulator n=1 Tax=Motiliproteus sediminis TaxID=1468178 RepID=UPI001AEFDE6F|nr:Lrp/AsnC family transcriptional regulator [Motiliproteus sediminis]